MSCSLGAADMLKHPAHGVRSGITLTAQQLHGVQRDDQAGQGVGHDVMNVPGQPGALGERRGPIPGLLGRP